MPHTTLPRWQLKYIQDLDFHPGHIMTAGNAQNFLNTHALLVSIPF